MKKIILAMAVGLLVPTLAKAEVITFDDHIGGASFYNFDADGNGQTDIIFSTTADEGLATSGPGFDQNFVQEPGLEGGVELTPDLRVDFLRGAVNSVSFAYALLSQGPTVGGEFTVYDAEDQVISSSFFYGDNTLLEDPDGGGGQPMLLNPIGGGGTPLAVDPVDGDGDGDGDDGGSGMTFSSFPEGEHFVDLGDATAAYATWDFGKQPESPTMPADFVTPERYLLDNFEFTAAGAEIINEFEGALPENPLLPWTTTEDGGFVIDGTITEDGLGTLFPIFIDPEIAIGYDYHVDGDRFFTSVVIPDDPNIDDDEFILTVGGVDYIIKVGETFGFALPVKSFRISGIDPNEELDPTDPTAFVTGLTFSGPSGPISVSQTPIIVDTTPPPPSAVPEPSTMLMFGVGLLALAGRRGNRK